MHDILKFFALIVSFSVTLLVTPRWVKIAEGCRLLGPDMNKFSRPEIAEIGGIPTLLGFLSGVFLYLLRQMFSEGPPREYTIALLLTVSLCGGIGLLDDMIGWKIGLRQLWKIWLGLFASLPLMVVSSERSVMILPFLGPLKLGFLYPLTLVPLGITGAANGFNMLAGYNGLEGKMGVVILTVLGIACWKGGDLPMGVVSLCMTSALLGFLYYNRYPARVFPGNTLTYAVGALIGAIAILARLEAIAGVLFAPYLIQFLLKARGRFQKESFAAPKEDGSLEVPYRTFYALEHMAIWLVKKLKGRAQEPNVSTFFMVIESVLGAAVLVMM